MAVSNPSRRTGRPRPIATQGCRAETQFPSKLYDPEQRPKPSPCRPFTNGPKPLWRLSGVGNLRYSRPRPGTPRPRCRSIEAHIDPKVFAYVERYSRLGTRRRPSYHTKAFPRRFMPTLVPRRTRRRRRCRTAIRRTLSGGRTESQCFTGVHPRVHTRSAEAMPFRDRFQPEGWMWLLDGDADGPPCRTRRFSSVSRRQLPDVPRMVPKGLPFPKGRLVPPYQSARGPHGPCPPEGVQESPSSSIVVAPLDASTPLGPRTAQGPNDPQRAHQDLPERRIWQIPQN